MWQALRNQPQLPREKWETSVTEHEVVCGLLEQNRNEISGLCIQRTIDGLKEAAQGGNAEAKKYYTVHDEERNRLDNLRSRAKSHVPPSCFRDYRVKWERAGITMASHREYVRAMAAAL